MSQNKITALYNGKVYTVDGSDWDKSYETAIAYDSEGLILAVGDEALSYEDAEKIDLQGKTVMPGFIDSHVHAPGTAFMEMFQIDLNDIHTKEETLDIIRTFIESNPDMDKYFGAGFDMAIVTEDGDTPCAAWLDDICADKPIVIGSYDMHSRWLNTKAMEVCGITEDSSVKFGHIHRYEDGSLKGVFTDCKELPILEPSYTEPQQLEAIKAFMARMNSWGYTSIMSIAPIMQFNPLRYMDLEKTGDLTMRINCAQMILPEDVEGSIANLVQLRNEMKDSDVKISTGKFLVDGVLEGKTACLKKPYSRADGFEEGYCGQMKWEPEALTAAATAVIKEGFQTHYHSIGDAATSFTLDAIETAQKETGNTELRNVITHLQVVDENDFDRFPELNVIAAIQPFWHFKEPGWFDNIDSVILGPDRAEKEYPVNSFAKRGVVLTSSGDYPVSPANNPLHGIQAGATRNVYNEDYGVIVTDPDDKRFLLGEDERITVKQMVESYTINGAYELFREKETGSLTVGKHADLVVLDSDIMISDVMDIHKVEVKATVFNGKLVYGTL